MCIDQGKIVKQYTEEEISRILKNSEGATVPGSTGMGHAEHLHELQGVGKRREHTNAAAIALRAEADRKETVSTFDGSQIAAITQALNSVAGRTSLEYLHDKNVEYVFTRINVRAGNFRIMEAFGETFAVEGRVLAVGGVRTEQKSAGCVCMKLMICDKKLHIRTAYPISQDEQSQCSIFYRNRSPSQVLPV